MAVIFWAFFAFLMLFAEKFPFLIFCCFYEIYEAKQNGTLAELLLPTDTVFAHLPEYQADEATVARLMNGAPTYRCRKPDGRWRVYGTDGTFLGLARTEGGTLKVEKLFVERG